MAKAFDIVGEEYVHAILRIFRWVETDGEINRGRGEHCARLEATG